MYCLSNEKKSNITLKLPTLILALKKEKERRRNICSYFEIHVINTRSILLGLSCYRVYFLIKNSNILFAVICYKVLLK